MRPDFDTELAIAHHAIVDEGDDAHGLHHLTGALSVRPNDPRALALLDAVIGRFDVLDALATETFLGAYAARARAMAQKGALGEAIGVACELASQFPDRGFEHWLGEWADRMAGADVDLGRPHLVLGGAMRVGMGRLRLLPTEREVLMPHAAFAEGLVSTEAAADDAPTWTLASGILRRVGRVERALEMADVAVGIAEDALGRSRAWCARGLALRALGRPDEAVGAFDAASAEEDDPSLHAERARAHADAGRWREARACLDALGEERRDREIDAMRGWIDACAKGDTTALAEGVDALSRAATHGWIPPMRGATANLMRGRALVGSKPASVAVTVLEAPSVRLCLARFAADDPEAADPRDVPMRYGEVPTPDPRRPWKGEPAVTVWRLEGDVPVPAHAPPSKAIRDAVDALARAQPDLTRWWEAASGHGPEAIDDLVRAILHPRVPADRTQLVERAFHTQVAALMMIARAEDGWVGSRRREVLRDLLHGPQGWVTAAVVLVLVEVALHTPTAFDEIRADLHELAENLPDIGHCAFAEALDLAFARLPFVDPHCAELTRALLDEQGAAPPPPPVEGAEETGESRLDLYLGLGMIGLGLIALLLRWLT